MVAKLSWPSHYGREDGGARSGDMTDRPRNIEFAATRREHVALAEPIKAVVAEALCGSGGTLMGPLVDSFEETIARLCRRKFAICVGSGTDALFFAMVSLGIGPGDEVLVPDISFIATASAVSRTGARPVFVDVDGACTIDFIRAAELVSARTKALIVVQLFGGMSDPALAEAFSRKHGLFLVEDAAQSFGARFSGRASGGVGTVSTLSFDPMKVLAAPTSAGAILTDEAELAARCRRLRYHGRDHDGYIELGYNSQMPSMTAAVLSMKLDHQARWTERRRVIADRYRTAFKKLPAQYPQWQPETVHVWHKFTLRVPNRNLVEKSLHARGVPTKVHYPNPFHREPLFGSLRSDGDFPNACAHADNSLSLPIHAYLTDEEIEYIAQAVVDCVA